METTCAACNSHYATNIYPWWFYVALTVALVLIVLALTLINFERFTDRHSPPDGD